MLSNSSSPFTSGQKLNTKLLEKLCQQKIIDPCLGSEYNNQVMLVKRRTDRHSFSYVNKVIKPIEISTRSSNRQEQTTLLSRKFGPIQQKRNIFPPLTFRRPTFQFHLLSILNTKRTLISPPVENFITHMGLWTVLSSVYS